MNGRKNAISSELSEMMQHKLQSCSENKNVKDELKELITLFGLQQKRSALINEKEFLIEQFQSEEGFHLFFYPSEGRLVHEGMAAVFAYRISQIKPIRFSIALNDYGFELPDDPEISIEQALQKNLSDTLNLQQDIYKSINITGMAERDLRDIAAISGLVFNGYSGKQKKLNTCRLHRSCFFKFLKITIRIIYLYVKLLMKC